MMIMPRVVTDKVRLSYVHLFKPYAPDAKSEAKYSAVVLVPKSDTATMQRINQAVLEAKQEGVNEVWKMEPPVLNVPIYDGDGVNANGIPFPVECKGHWVFTASAKVDFKPEVVDVQCNPIIDQSQVYSGMYARVSLNTYPYDYMGKKGVGIGLGNVQKVADGTPLGGGRSAADDFGPTTGAVGNNTSQGYNPAQYAGGYQPAANTAQVDPITGQAVQQSTGIPQAVDPITGSPIT